jgi:uncharacterized protein (TIGR02452 family)
MKTKEELVKIFEVTLEAIRVGGYENMKGDWVDLEQEDLKQGSKFYVTTPALQTSRLPTYDTRVYVVNRDTFQEARSMGPDCAVLNMASFSSPGGGVIFGARAQEEELCRRSNLYLSLSKYDPRSYKLGEWDEPDKTYHYPIPVFGGIYSPKVSVFRSVLSYSFIDSPFQCNVISVPAVKKPEIDSKTGDMISKYEAIMCGKIRAIFRIALRNNIYKLVLGAMGCGAYGCPPKHVARLFKKVLEEKEFRGKFKEICFAIIDDAKKQNLRTFREIFWDAYN